LADTAYDKSIAPTPRRRQQAREQGQVAHSHDLASAGLLIAGLAALLMLGGKAVEFFGSLAQRQLSGDAWLSMGADANSVDFIVRQWRTVGLELLQVLAPIIGLFLLAAVVMHLVQTGFLWLPERLLPDWGRINPITGFGRIFSASTAVRLGLGVLKLGVVSLVAFWSLYHRRDEILGLAALEPQQIAAAISEITIWTSLKIALALGALAVLDYGYQRWKLEQDLRMTPQELREELKNLQGDPQMLAKRRDLQNKLSKAAQKSTLAVSPVEKS
jgi:flagellar biosynthesis protein FlhB